MTAALHHLRPQDLLARNMEVQNLALSPAGLLLRNPAEAGHLTTHPIEVPSGFDHATLSWNILEGEGGGFAVRFRVRGRHAGWSPWLPPQDEGTADRLDSEWDWSIDQVQSKRICSHFQVDLQVRPSDNPATSPPSVRGIYFSSRNSGVFELACLNDIPMETPPIERIPHLCQHDQGEKLGPRLCSPTALAMVLRGMGIETSVGELAEACYDPRSDLYGVWPRAIHAAFQRRALGWVEYIGNWGRAVHYLKRGIPLICSIAFRKDELEDPPYPSTEGHLLVLLGVDSEGSPITHDPNLPSERGAYLKWKPKDFSRAWFGHGGAAYVIQGKVE